jgi:hypothetical protein
VEEMDWSSGEIITALRKLQLMDNTIIYFSSDNGGHKEEHHGYLGYRTGGHNGIYRGGCIRLMVGVIDCCLLHCLLIRLQAQRGHWFENCVAFTVDTIGIYRDRRVYCFV